MSLIYVEIIFALMASKSDLAEIVPVWIVGIKYVDNARMCTICISAARVYISFVICTDTRSSLHESLLIYIHRDVSIQTRKMKWTTFPTDAL